MAPVTRNQSKSESGSTPLKTPSSKTSEKREKQKPGGRIDPTTKLSFNQLVLIGVLVGTFVQAGLGYLVFYDKIRLHGKVTAEGLKNFGPRLEFILRYQALNVLWLLLTTAFVVIRRIGSGAVNPLENMENLCLAQKMIHQNSMEQFILTFVNQLILATTLAPDLFLRVIPLMNVLYFVARVLFWLGYPKYRTAGFLINIFPVTVATFYNFYGLYKFIM